MLIIPWLLGPKKPSKVKSSTFEAGQASTGEIRMNFMMQYYAYLLAFVVFDVISMFLFSWAISILNLGIGAIITMVLFLAILSIPLGYALVLAGRRSIW
jgi:NADH-quinone oxidoreductase subunit A